MTERSFQILTFFNRYRKILLVFLAVFFIFGFTGLFKLRIDNTIKVWFVDTDPSLSKYRKFIKEFGNDEIIVTLLTDSMPVGDLARLKRIDDATQRVARVKGVFRVSSITNIPVILRGQNMITFTDILKENVSQETIDKEFRKIKHLRTVRRYLGKKENATLIYCWIDTIPDIEEIRGDIIHSVDSLIRISVLSGNVSHGGTGIIYNSINQETISDSSIFSTLSFLLVVIFMYLFTRRWIWVLSMVTVVVAVLVIIFGLMGLFGISVNMTLVALSPLIIIISLVSIIHFAKHYESDAAHENPDLIRSTGNVLVPVLFNALTTAGGFLSLATAKMKITREYGLIAGISVLTTLIVSVLVLIMYRHFIESSYRIKKTGYRTNNLVEYIMLFSVKNKKIVIVCSCLIAIVSVFGIVRIKVDTKTLDMLPGHHQTRIDNSRIEQTFGGYIPLDFIISPKKNISTEKILTQISQFQKIIENDSLSIQTLSLADIRNDLRRITAMNRQPGFVPINSSTILKAGDETKLYSKESNSYRLSVFGPMCSARELIRIANKIEKKGKSFFEGNAKFRKSGYLPLYSQIIKQILHDQVSSIAVAFIVIFILIGLLFGSVTYTLLAIPVNILPVAMILGMMGYTGIWLDIATVTVAAAVLGIIVDDTIQILYFLKKYNTGNTSLVNQIGQVSKHTGSAILSTTVIIILGFGILSFAGIRSIASTGLLISMAAFFAFLCDVVLLPALIAALKK